jgi:hypothetical protein
MPTGPRMIEIWPQIAVAGRAQANPGAARSCGCAHRDDRVWIAPISVGLVEEGGAVVAPDVGTSWLA